MTNPFSRTTLFAIIGVVAVSLAAAVYLSVTGKDMGEMQSAGAHAYSSSAIGHRALVKLLGKLDVPVVVSRSNSPAKAGKGLLVIAEPTVNDDLSRERLRKLLSSDVKTLIVLPKWYGQAERGKHWIGDASFIPVEELKPLFEILDLTAHVDRAAMPLVLVGSAVQPAIREPQLVTSPDIVAQVSIDDDILFGQIGETKRWLLTDPDVLNNYGLRKDQNAEFIVRMIDQLRDGGPVVFDETLHGYAEQPSLLRTLFHFPLVLATLQVLVCALLAVWAAMVRFGPRKAAPPPLAPGKDFLVRNTAALLQYGGHHKHALGRYLQLTVGAVCRELHAPVLAPHEATAWLERVRAVRRGKISLVEVERAVAAAKTPQSVVEAADQVFRWRMEMTNASGIRS